MIIPKRFTIVKDEDGSLNEEHEKTKSAVDFAISVLLISFETTVNNSLDMVERTLHRLDIADESCKPEDVEEGKKILFAALNNALTTMMTLHNECHKATLRTLGPDPEEKANGKTSNN